MSSIQTIFADIWNSTFPTNLARAICVAVVAELLLFLLNRSIRRALQPVLGRAAGEDATVRVRRRRIVLGVPLLIARVVIYALALLMIARFFGFHANLDLYPVCAAVVLFAAIALRAPLRDAAAGYYLMYDHVFGLGDEIRTGEITGTVQETGLRSTTVLTRDGKEIAIPNGEIRTVINLSRGLKATDRGQ